MRWPEPQQIIPTVEKQLFNEAIREVKNITVASDFDLANVLETWKNSYPWKQPISVRRYSIYNQESALTNTIGIKQFYWKFNGDTITNSQFSLSDNFNEVFFGKIAWTLESKQTLGNPTDIRYFFSTPPNLNFPTNNFQTLLFASGSFGPDVISFPYYSNLNVPVIGFSLEWTSGLAANVEFLISWSIDGFIITTN